MSDYDVERKKRESEEIRTAMREIFPLCAEGDLPWAACQIKGFLRDRIKREVELGVFYFQSAAVRVLCDISPPKSHFVDMCRIVVDAAKNARAERDRLQEQLSQIVTSLGLESNASQSKLLETVKSLRASTSTTGENA